MAATIWLRMHAQGKFLMSVSVPLLPVAQFILRELTGEIEGREIAWKRAFHSLPRVGVKLACLTQRGPVADESSYKINW